MASNPGASPNAAPSHELVATKFGGWYEGDNRKPGRGFYYVCSCGKIGLGELLPASAHRAWKKHAEKAKWEARRAAA